MSQDDHLSPAEQDRRWMRHAIALAARGDRRVRPNPRVGCVLVRDDRVVGEGWHAACGGPHAEAAALADAGERARGATAYVTLEPCNHHGRTPPCAGALVAAGVARVVVGVADPHPTAAGGVATLEAAGVAVTLGVCEQEATDVAAVFHTNQTERRAHVRVKLAATLDGFTAAADGTSQWITGPEARRAVHALRADADAVMVGSGTALVDDPALTVRHVAAAVQPLRVVLDRRLRLPPTHQLASTSHAPTLVLTEAPELLDQPRCAALRERGVDVVCVPTPADQTWLGAVLAHLLARGVHSVLCEGGHQLAGSLLRAGLVDHLDVVVAPKLLGAGRRLWPELGIATLAEARQLRMDPPRQVGADIWLSGRPARGER